MKKHGGNSLETPVASLIDVVFLLIIFFVVTAAVETEIVDETIQLARARSVRAEERRHPLTVTINVTHDGGYNIARQSMNLRQIHHILYATMVKHGGEVPILIRADGRTEYRHVADLQDVITNVGFYRVRLAAIGQP